jgi:rod shape-determining protein MreB and related proteins
VQILRSLSSALGGDLAIDLGTANTLVYSRGDGIVCNEPSVVALRLDGHGQRRLLAVGAAAKNMLGRTPPSVAVVRPLKDGVIADFEIAQEMLGYFIGKIRKRKNLFRPRLVISVPSEISSIEKRAVKESAEITGARNVCLIEEPLAAAIGAGLSIAQPLGQMIVDIGGGTSDIAVLSLGDVVCSRSLRIGGDKMDEAIIQHLRRRYNLHIGERTAELIKVMLGSARPDEEIRTIEVIGRDASHWRPKTVEVDDEEIRQALAGPVSALIESVQMVLQHTPPELFKDISEKGILMTGGGALLRNLDALLSETVGITARRSDDPLTAVVLGAGKLLEDQPLLDRVALD